MSTINGTSASENLNGGSGDDVILAGAGNDVVSGGSGADFIDGGTGNDRLTGGSGDDILNGGAGSDTVSGDAGDDTLIYDTTNLNLGNTASSKDVYDGGSGYDTLRLLLNSTTWTSAQAQLASFNTFLNANMLPSGEAKNTSFIFTFGNYTLDASKIEKLVINLNGADIGVVTAGNDSAVVSGALAASTKEDTGPSVVNALSNAWDAEGASLTVTGYGVLPAGVTYNATTRSFTLDTSNAAYQDLAVGETRQVTVNYNISDGVNATPTSVTWTIAGTNDAPTITSGTTTGGVTEDAASPITTTGSIAFTDVDLSDTHTASFTAASGNPNLGTFALGSVSEAANAANGSVGWTYTLNNAAAQKLAAGQTVTETYTVTVDDGHGGTVAQTVTVTVTGVNDGPTIVAGGTNATGAVTEDTTLPITATGSVAFNDVDLTDAHTASFTAASGNPNLGTFALSSVSEAANAADGSVGWTYTLNNAAAQKLAAGQTVTETYTVTVDDGHGGTVEQTVTVTVTGTNDEPTITVAGTDAEGAVTEDAAATTLSDSGTIVFNDVDLIDVHTTSVTPAAGNTLGGTLTMGAVSESATTEPGSVGWTYNVANAATQYLAAGETATESFTVTIDDGEGGTVDQLVTVTVTGTNDEPTITVAGTDAEGAVTEDTAAPTLSDSGTIVFNDVDLIDVHTTSVTPAAGNTLGGTLTMGAVSESATTEPGSVGWTYNVANAATQYLAAGETATESFTVTIDDGEGGTVDQLVSVTVTGTNDEPTITVAGTDAEGAVTEDAAATTLSDSGTIVFNDVDLIDVHTTSVTPAAGNTLGGTLTMGAVSESATTEPGSVGWTYNVANAATQYLAAGETATESFTVTIDDGEGGTVDQLVTVTVTGTNDEPTITVAGTDAEGAVTEDTAATTLSDSGTIVFNDVDLIDVHTTSVTPAAGNTLGGTLTMGAVSESATTEPGSVGWTYNVANAATQYLAAGETATESFTVTIDDGEGGTVDQLVTVTVTGTNDEPTITVAGTDAEGAVTEDTAAPTLSDSGTIVFNDVDLIDVHTTNVTPAAGNTLGGTLTMGAVSESATTEPGSVGWTYNVANAATQYLAAGETATESFTVTIDDGEGGTVDQLVTVTVTGTNDEPTITVAGTDAEGAVTEDAAATTLSDSGTIVFNDVDLIDVHTTSVTPAAGNTLGGTLTMGAVSESATTEPGSVGWTYNVANAATQYLAAGETATESFTVTIDDGEGGTVDQLVTVTVTGTNDEPTITVAGTDAEGAVTEDAAATTLSDSGTIVFNDVDLIDVHTTSVTPAAGNTLGGTLTMGAVSESATTEPGSVGWTYNVANAATQYLAAGETATESFTVTIDDGEGGTVDQLVTVTVTGTNDEPTITVAGTDAEGAVTEDAAATTLSDSGTIVFNDVDLIDVHTTSVTPAAGNTLGGTLTMGAVSESATTEPGSVGWTYNVANAATQYLAAGQQVTESFVVTVDDGEGGTVEETVSVTITGTNDEPTITSGAQTGAVTEDAAAPITAAGSIAFTDVDLADGHTASYVAAAANTTTLGTFALAPVSEDADAADGSVGWTYTLNNGAAQYLAAGQQVTESFVVTVDDGEGGTVEETVSVTITGTNDEPTITSGAQTGAVTEDAAAPITAAGSIAFTDVDLADGHTASYVAAAANTTTLGTFALAPVSEDADAADGSVGWTYTLNNGAAQYLAAGQQVTESFVVTVDDGEGGTVEETVSVTITGTNDEPTITSGAQTGAVTEDAAAPITAAGSIAFTDVDLADGHTASYVAAAANTTTLGTFALAPVSEDADAADGSVGWTYTLNNGAAQYLAAGQQVTESFVVTVDDGEGGTVEETVSVTITGTNDEPTITSGAQTGAVTEDAAAPITAAGSIAFTDVDLADGHTASYVAAAANTTTLGTFALAPVSEDADAADGSVGWTYTLNNGAAQYLAAGQQVTESFVVTVDDGEGGTVEETVSVTITGTNDEPTITSGAQTGAVTEDAAAPITAAGSIAFTDVDLADGHTASYVAAAANTTTLGTFALAPVSEDADAADGSVGWTYTLNNGAAQYLAAGQQVTESFVVTVDDGEGGTVEETVSVTITGTNDEPTITSGAQTGAVTEDAAAPITAAGSIAFTDVDLADGHTASYVAAAANTTTLGTFALAPVSEDADAADGSVGWTYTLNNGAAQYLAAGQQVTESFVVTVDDGEGGTVEETVSVTITGTNDEPTITSGAQTGAVTEDAAAPITAAGSIAFTDVDLADGHTASYVAAAANTTTLGTFALAPVSEDADAADGSVGWTYTLNNGAAQYLAAGQQVTESFVVTVDDGEGGTVEETVSVTITGTNDEPTITSGAQTGAVTEDAAAPITAAGSIAFTDVDLADGHTASYVAAAANTTTLGTFALAPVSEDADAADGSVGWTYTLNNGAAQYLAAGQQVTESFVVTVDDGEGGTVEETVSVTITGTNDEPTITSGAQTGAVTEDAAAPITAAGSIAFTDVDLADGHTASYVAAAANTTTLGTFALAPVSEDADAADGSVGWTYTLNNGAAQYLAAGQQVTESFVVTVDDGEGGTVEETVSVTITGTNDEPTITSGAQTGAVTEDAAAPITAAGSIAFTDVDLADGHTASYVAAAANTTTLGTFALAPVSEDADAADGSVGWTYTLNNGAAQYLAAGQQVTESFVVTVDDGEGGTVEETVSVTITGTNDEPTITSGAQTGAVTEDAAAPITAAGSIAFTDVDLADGHTASYVAAAANTTTLGTFALAPVSEDADAADGSVGWTYTLNNGAAQYLAAGQQVTESFVVTVDDGEGGTVEETVSVTITGTNDEPTVSAALTDTAAEGAPAFTRNLLTGASDVDSGETATLTVVNVSYVVDGGPSSNTAPAGLSLAGAVLSIDPTAAAFDHLAAGDSTTIVVSYDVKDAQGATVAQTETVTITGTNDAPVISSDGGGATATLQVDENTTAVTTVQAGDVDDGAVVGYSISGGADAAFFQIDASSGVLTFVSAPDYEAFADQDHDNKYEVTVQASDGSLVDTQALTISIRNVNEAPVNSVPGSLIVNEDTNLSVTGVSVSDPDSGASSISTSLSVEHGVLIVGSVSGGATVTGSGGATVTLSGTTAQINATLAASNNVVYRGDLDYNGADTLTVVTNDGGATGSGPVQSDTDTVSITVNAVNDGPVNVTPGAQTVAEDTNLSVTGLSVSDVDAGGATLTTTLSVTQGTLTVLSAGGAAVAGSGTGSVTLTGTAAQINTTLAASNNVVYRGASNFNGGDTLTVVTNDGGATGSGGIKTDTDTVAITVTPVNDAPVAVNDTLTAVEDTPVTYTASQLVGNDTDVDNPNSDLRVFSVTSGTGGTAVLNANGTVTFTPNANFTGAADFTYKVSDGVATSTGSATVTVNTSAVNDPPINVVPGAQTVAEDTNLSVTGLSVSDVDAGGATLTTTLSVTQGTLTVLSAGGAAVSGSGTGSVTLTGTAAQINTTLAASNNVVYRGASNFNGGDTLTVVTSDGGATGSGGTKTDTDTVAITVTPVNDAPVAVNDTLTAVEDTPVTYTASQLVGNDTDVDNPNSDLRVFSVTSGTGGTAVLNANGTVTFTPNANFTGAADFTYKVSDGVATSTGSATVTVNTSAVNDPPINVVPGAQTVAEDTNLSVTGLSVSDVDAGTAQLTTTLSVTQGTLTVAALGGATVSNSGTALVTIQGTASQINATLAGNNVLYRGASNYNGADTLTVVTSDNGATGSGGTKTDTDTVTITVTPVNDAPVNTVPGAQTANGGQAKVIAGLSVSDVDDAANGVTGDQTVSITLGVSHGALALGSTTGLTLTDGSGADGTLAFSGSLTNVNAALATLSYTATLGYSGSDVLSLTSSDLGNFGAGGALSDTDTVSISVTSANAAPTANADLLIKSTGTNPAFFAANALLQNDTDPENDTLTFVGVSGGSATYDATTGLITWSNSSGGTFTYQMKDSAGTVVTGTATVQTVNVTGGGNAVNISAQTYAASYIDAANGDDTVTGGGGWDQFVGGSGADVLVGDTSADTLSGGADGDSLSGGGGYDRLIGGAGADTLSGGTGADLFDYDLTSDSPTSGPDRITDFQAGVDKIDLSAIDANTSGAQPGDQAFAFVAGQTSSVVANSITWIQSGGDTIVRVDNNGSGGAEMVITLTGTHNLTASDFIL